MSALRPATPPKSWPPVAPGRDGATRDTTKQQACHACKSEATPRALAEVDYTYMILCTDAAACCRRYRAGRTPLQFAALLSARTKRIGMAA